jgi:site-specific recombinase XerD
VPIRTFNASSAYLRNQRGLSERAIYHCWRFADRFLQFRLGGKVRDLSKIAWTDIVGSCSTLRGKPFRDKTPPTHLRNFFRFLFKSEKTNVNLTPTVPRVAQKYASSLPRHLTPEQVKTLIAAVRTDTATGRRNYAMVLPLALRAAEVIAIRIDDIDGGGAGHSGMVHRRSSVDFIDPHECESHTDL